MIVQNIVNGRCGWCGTDDLYVKYHDEEWGKLVTDDKIDLAKFAGGVNRKIFIGKGTYHNRIGTGELNKH